MASIATWSIACGSSDDDDSLYVQLDGERFVPTHVNASFFSVGTERHFSLTAATAGSDDTDDEEWFTLSVRLQPEALVAGVLPIHGAAILVDRVPGENRGIPREEELTFEAGSDHDPRVLGAWAGHHRWFSSWDGDQSQTITGQIALESVDAGGVRGSLGILVSGQLPPVSGQSDHQLRLVSQFRTGPIRERGEPTE